MEEKKNLAMEEKAAQQPSIQEEEDDVSMVIKFKKPFVFEGKTYTEIDLSALENVTVDDMVAVNKIIGPGAFGRVEMNPEFSLEYACHLAARATKMPVEFFFALRPGDGLKVKNRVINFFFS